MSSTNIKTGRWTDWSKGEILGDQVTLSNTDANILIAFIAVLNTFVGAVVWKAVAYGLHQSLVTKSPRDGLHHQYQILLRSSESSVSFAIKAFTYCWSWRDLIPKKTRFLRLVMLVTPAVIVFSGFTALSVFLSKVATVGDVLLESQYCGEWNKSLWTSANLDDLEVLFDAFSTDLNKGASASYAYAIDCYGLPRASSSQPNYDFRLPTRDCNYFVQPRLNWTTSFPEECPFQDGLCDLPNVVPIRFDTGYINSHTDLGMNAATRNRLELRQVMTCSPINTENFTVNSLNENLIPELDRSIRMYFGNNTLEPTFTYTYYANQSRDSPYLLSTASDRTLNTVTDIPYTFNDLLLKTSRAEASVSLFFLANQASYVSYPVKDPWFNATSPIKATLPTLQFIPAYASEAIVGVVGCSTTLEVCNPAVSPRSCLPANDLDLQDLNAQLGSIKLNDIQAATARILLENLYPGGVAQIAASIGPKALTAHDCLLPYPGSEDPHSAHFSLPVPDNQWHIELKHLFAASMAVLQLAGWVLMTVGDADPSLTPWINRDNLQPSTEYLCNNQKVYDSAHTSFSVLSLVLIFCLDFLLILLGVTVEFIIPKLQKRSKNTEFKRRAWAANSVTQMHRGLYQLVGHGEWEGDIYNVPLTKRGVKLTGFHDIEDLVEVPWNTSSLVKDLTGGSSTDEHVSTGSLSNIEGVSTDTRRVSAAEEEHAYKMERSPASLRE